MGAGPRRVLQLQLDGQDVVGEAPVRLRTGVQLARHQGAAREHEVRAVGEALLRGSGEDRRDRDQQEATDDHQHLGRQMHGSPSLPPPARPGSTRVPAAIACCGEPERLTVEIEPRPSWQSGGVTMASALVSVVTGRMVRGDLAMSGEVTLSGQLLAVGNIAEKPLAAHGYGLGGVILPRGKEREVDEEVGEELRRAVKVDYVTRTATARSTSTSTSRCQRSSRCSVCSPATSCPTGNSPWPGTTCRPVPCTISGAPSRT